MGAIQIANVQEKMRNAAQLDAVAFAENVRILFIVTPNPLFNIFPGLKEVEKEKNNAHIVETIVLLLHPTPSLIFPSRLKEGREKEQNSHIVETCIFC